MGKHGAAHGNYTVESGTGASPARQRALFTRGWRPPCCTRDSAFPGRAPPPRRTSPWHGGAGCTMPPHRSCSLLPVSGPAPSNLTSTTLGIRSPRGDGCPLSVHTAPTVFLRYIIVKMSVFLVYDSIKLW
ncbi:hypothetical protein B5X24_HaOG210437 [Helicoverpa armigera]|nr:hypothetical protein B5X24_HaOG210437 [Helicoverpa armigera]